MVATREILFLNFRLLYYSFHIYSILIRKKAIAVHNYGVDIL